jgi:hypothetical protein
MHPTLMNRLWKAKELAIAGKAAVERRYNAGSQPQHCHRKFQTSKKGRYLGAKAIARNLGA